MDKLSRREFLGTAAAAGGMLLASGLAVRYFEECCDSRRLYFDDET